MPVPSICQATCGGIATQLAEQAPPNSKTRSLDQSQNVDGLGDGSTPAHTNDCGALAIMPLAYSMRLKPTKRRHLLPI